MIKKILFIMLLTVSYHLAKGQQKGFSDTSRVLILKNKLGISSEKAAKAYKAMQTNSIAIEGLIKKRDLKPAERQRLLHPLIIQRDSAINAVLTPAERGELKAETDKDHEDMKQRHHDKMQRQKIKEMPAAQQQGNQ